MPSDSNPPTRPRTRSQVRAENNAAPVPAPAPEPVPEPVVKNARSRVRTKSSGTNETRVVTAVKPRVRTRSSPATPAATSNDPAPVRRSARFAAAPERVLETDPVIAQYTQPPAPDQRKKRTGRPLGSKKVTNLHERATTAAALAKGKTPPPRLRTRSMATDAREVRFQSPTPPSDVAQSLPVRAPRTPVPGATDTKSSSVKDVSSLESTPMGTTTANLLSDANFKKGLKLELGNNVELADEAYTKGLYVDLIDDSVIEDALEAIGYDKEAQYGEDGTGRWVNLPENPTNEAAFQKPITNLVAAILEKLGTKDGRNTRRVEDTSSTLLQHSDHPDHSTKPDISIVATGPSFELPHVKSNKVSKTIGYTNLATAFDAKIEKNRQGHSAHIQQMGIYARQIFIQQPNRKFVRTLIITEHNVRLIHFDRSGAKYTPFLNIHQDPYTFVRLILGLSSHKEEVLGLDTNIQWTIKKGKKVAGTIKMVDSNQKTIIYDLIDVHPVFHRAALRGRGTTCWHARDRKGSPLDAVLIKDAWRVDDRASEHTLLENIRGVNGVAQMLHFCDGLAQTKDFRGNQIPSEPPTFFNRICLRVVLKQYGHSLRHFTSQTQAIGALRDTLGAHARLLEQRSVLHRDISMQNILLGLEDALPGLRGILIDFDMAVKSGPRETSRLSADCRTGTRMYQSLSVLDSYDATSKATAHDYLDDIESFFLVLTHLMYGWAGVEQELNPKPKFMRGWDAEDPRDAFNAKDGFMAKRIKEHLIPSFWSDPCRDLWESFRAFIKEIADRKEAIREMKTPEARLKSLQKLHSKRNTHYNTVKKLFDKALDELERYGEAPSARPDAPDEPDIDLDLEGTDADEEPMSSPSDRLRGLKRGSDDFEGTPSKRNRTRYAGSHLADAMDEGDETFDH